MHGPRYMASRSNGRCPIVLSQRHTVPPVRPAGPVAGISVRMPGLNLGGRQRYMVVWSGPETSNGTAVRLWQPVRPGYGCPWRRYVQGWVRLRQLSWAGVCGHYGSLACRHVRMHPSEPELAYAGQYTWELAGSVWLKSAQVAIVRPSAGLARRRRYGPEGYG